VIGKWDVVLDWPEIILGANAGVMRRVNAVRNRREEPYGERPTASWNHDINGALAEIALAKKRDIFWCGAVGRIALPDVGPLQVRSKTALVERLVVLESDDGSRAFVSVFVDLPICRLCGWMLGKDAKRDEWIVRDPLNPTAPRRFFVPNDKLEPMEALK
jgi:hypothetical protein